jgi:lysophospholipase L1-like esterase
MPLGDSLTAGWNPTQQALGPGYRGPLCALLDGRVTFVGSQTGGPPLPCSNAEEGHPGWEIPRLTAQVDGWLAATHPDVILLLAGTNDIDRLPGDPLIASAPADLSALVTRIISDTPNSTLLVSSIPPTGVQDWTTQAISYNATIPGLVATEATGGAHIAAVDMFRAITTTDLADVLHPTAAGYAKMAAVWATALARAGVIAAPVATATARPTASTTGTPTPIETPTASVTATPRAAPTLPAPAPATAPPSATGAVPAPPALATWTPTTMVANTPTATTAVPPAPTPPRPTAPPATPHPTPATTTAWNGLRGGRHCPLASC